MDKQTEKAIRYLCRMVALNAANHEKTKEMSYERFGERISFWETSSLLICGLKPESETTNENK